MKVNVGNVDRILRIITGIVLITLAAAGIFSPWGWIGALPLLTGIIKFCPAYSVFGLNSCPKDNK